MRIHPPANSSATRACVRLLGARRSGAWLPLLLIALAMPCGLRGQNIPRPNIAAPSGVQVNSYAGSLYYARTDFSIPSPGLPLDVTFSYSSTARGTDAGFGWGWIFGYNQGYTIDSTGAFILLRADGRQDRFTPTIGGGWQAPTGIFDVLTQYQTGKYRLTEKNGTQHFFDNATHKKLTRIQDLHGNKTVLGYSGNNLSTITDSLGHLVTLTWTGNRVTEIVAQGGGQSRKVKYEYNAAGCLVQVRRPMGVVLSYTYLPNRALASFVDGNGNYTLVTYNGNNAVVKLVSCGLEQRISYNLEQRKTYLTEVSDGKTLATTYAFDAAGRMVQKSGNCCGYNVTYEYDAQNNVSKMTDGNGGVSIYTYDARGNVTAETDPLGKTTLYTYNTAFNKVTGITDKRGNQTTFSYNAQGSLTQVTDPLAHALTYTYDSRGNKLTATDKKGFITNYSYDAFGYLNRIIGAGADTTAFENDAWGNILSTTNPRQATTAYSYDSLNRLTAMVDAAGGTSAFAYDPNGNQTSATDPRGKTTTYTYNWRNQPLSATDALSHTTAMGYDGMGNMVSSTNANGRAAQYEYDNLSRLTSETNAAGESTTYRYDGVGNKTGITYPNGHPVTLKYDAANRVTEVSDAVGILAKYTYDAAGNKLTEQDGKGATTSYTYDALNRVLTVTDPLGNASSFAYDFNDNLVQETDRKGASTTYTYDSLDRRKTATDALNHITAYGYDKAGNLKSVTDANGNATLYTYDALNRLVQEKFADNTTKLYTYDSASNLKTRTDNSGLTTTFTYDAVNRPVLRSYSASVADTFSYDNIGLLLSARSAGAAVAFTYDAANRLASESLNGKVTAYTYLTAARKKRITYPGGRIVERVANGRGQLTHIRENGGVAIAEFEYDAAGQPTKRTLQNGTVTNLAYDANGRVTDLDHNPARFVDFGFSYDKEGNPTAAQFRHQTAHSEVYGYDNLHQLTSYSKGGNPQGSYAYDGVGNRTTATLGGTPASYTVNAMNAYSSILSGGSVTLTYDANGNLTANGTHTFAYDRENRMIAVNGGAVARYAYDALGRRIQKIVGTDTTHFFYDGLQVVEERSGSDSIKATYVWGRWVDDIVQMQRGGQGYFYHTNPLGSVVSVTNGAGAVVERYEYDVYGRATVYDGAFGLLAGGSGIGNRYFFTGREWDAEVGLYYYRARSYSAGLGRFMQRDPLGYGDGLGLYAYVGNATLRMVDPLGTIKVDCNCLKGKIFKEESEDLTDLLGEPGSLLDEFGGALDEYGGKLGASRSWKKFGAKIYFSEYARGNGSYKIVSGNYFKALSWLGHAVTVLEFGEAFIEDDYSFDYNSQQQLAGTAVGTLGAWAGGVVFGALGTLIAPGPGTIAGAALGSYIFGSMGESVGEDGYRWAMEKLYRKHCTSGN